MNRIERVVAVFAIVASAACASGPGTPATAQTPPASGNTSARDTLPIGFGTLKQDEITVSIRTGALLVKVTPLNESVIRLTAPDTYRRLHALAESRREEATRGIGERELFLVSFFSYQPDVTFQPEDVQLSHQGRSLRPEAIVPLTAGWGQQRMQQQENQTAIYAVQGPIDFDQDLLVRYGQSETDMWRGFVAKLQAERVKVKTRADAGN